MKRVYCLLIFTLSFCFPVQAQDVYTSIANGNWNGGAAVWSVVRDGNNTNDNGASPGIGGTKTNDIVIINGGRTVTFNASVTVDSISIGQGGTSGTLTFDGTSRNLTVNVGLGIQSTGAIGTTDLINHNLYIKGRMYNAGTADFNRNTSSSVRLHFSGSGKMAITGEGTWDLGELIFESAVSDSILLRSTTFSNDVGVAKSSPVYPLITYTGGIISHESAGSFIDNSTTGTLSLPVAVTLNIVRGTFQIFNTDANNTLNVNGAVKVNGGNFAVGGTGTVNDGWSQRMVITAGGSFTMNGSSSTASVLERLQIDNGGTFTINDGVFELAPTLINANTGISHLANSGAITVNGGEFNIMSNATILNGVTGNIVLLGSGGSSYCRVNGGNVNVVRNIPAISASVAPTVIAATALVIDGGNLNIAPNLTSKSGSTPLFLANRVDIKNGLIRIAYNPGFTSYPFNAPLFESSNLQVGDGAGASETASLIVAPNLAKVLPTPTSIDIVRISNLMHVESDGLVRIGGGNTGNLSLNTSGDSLIINGGSCYIHANLSMPQGTSNDVFIEVRSGKLDIGTAQSNGTNTILFDLDRTGGICQLLISGGEVNVGDGSSVLALAGGSNNNPTGFSFYNEINISGGQLNLNGSFYLGGRSPAAAGDYSQRLIMTGGEFNINPQGFQNTSGTTVVCNLRRGAVSLSGTSKLVIVNPNVNSGGDGTSTGLALYISNISFIGQITSSDLLSGPGDGAAFVSSFAGGHIAFGNGIAANSGSQDGFDAVMSSSYTYGTMTVNNPAGNNRHVTLVGQLDNQTITINNLNVIAGALQAGYKNTTSPYSVNRLNTYVTGSNLTLGSGSEFKIASDVTSPSDPFPVYSTYSIDINSTINYVSPIPSGVQIVNGRGQAFGHLTIGGSGSRQITSANIVRGVFQMDGGSVDIGANLTLANNATFRRNGTDTEGIISAGTIQQGAGNIYTVEYTGVSKTIQPNDFSGSQKKSLKVDVNSNQTLTLEAAHAVDDLTLSSGTFSDNGNVLTVNKGISGSGAHTGSGKILLSGGASFHPITGTAQIQNIELNDAFGSVLTSGASLTINGTLTLTSGLFDIGVEKLTIGLSGTAAGSFNNTRMIKMSGVASAQGLTKYSQAGVTYTLPVGVGSKYTPVTVFLENAVGNGPITVRAVNNKHPYTQDAANRELNFFWRLSSSGITATKVDYTFTYNAGDVTGTEGSYVAALYQSDTGNWIPAFTGSSINTGTHQIIVNDAPYLEGDFTAGEASEFGTITTYYSLGGNWNTPASWSTIGFGGAAAGSAPLGGSRVLIGDNRTITVSAELTASVPSVELAGGSTLQLQTVPAVTSFGEASGQGTVIIENSNFPLGDFTEFLGSAGGTIEYSGAGSYTIPASTVVYRHMKISGGGIKTLPNANLAIAGNFSIAGGTLVQLSSGANGNLTIKGSLKLTGASSTLRYMNGTARSVTVDSNVVLNAGTVFDVGNSATVSNTLAIGSNSSNAAGTGNLTNTNGTFKMLNGTGIVDVTFAGSQNSSITVPAGGSSTTIFNRLTVNKGVSYNSVLDVVCSNTSVDAFKISGPTNVINKALSIRNGTFKLSAANTNGTVDGVSYAIDLSTLNGNFSIPATGGLSVAAAAIVLSGPDDIDLRGLLEVSGTGKIYVGTQPDGDVQNSIIYSGSQAKIFASGAGLLQVGSGITAAAGTVALNYTQSGGTVTVGRYSSEAGGIFEISSHANSAFIMTAGNLNIVRGGGGILIRNVTSAITPGGTIQIGNADTPVNETFGYTISNTINLPNIIIGGGSYNGTVGVISGTGPNFGWIIRGNFTLNRGTFRTYSTAPNSDPVPLSIAGNLAIQNGTLALGQPATMTIGGNFTQTGGTFTPNASSVRFNGNTTPQVIDVGGSLSLNSIDISNTAPGGVVRLAAGTDLLVSGSWATTSGNLDAGTNNPKVTFIGTSTSFVNGATSFYDLEIKKNSGVNVNLSSGSITVGNILTLTTGVLNLNDNALILTNTSTAAISVTGSSGTDKIIRTSGTANALGVTKYYSDIMTGSFTFPMGTGTIYTPATLNVTNLGTGTVTPKITVIPIAIRHPIVTSTSAMDYYWSVDMTGFGVGTAVSHQYVCPVSIALNSSDQGGFYSPVNFVWTTNAAYTLTSDAINRTVVFNNLTPGYFEYTAGKAVDPNGAFNAVQVYYSRQTGDWNTAGTWSQSGIGGSNCGCVPTAGRPVVIGGKHTITRASNGISIGALTFRNDIVGPGVLDLGSTTGHNLGIVRGSGAAGDKGTIKLSTATIPTGVFGNFIAADGGTFEYSGGSPILLSGTFTTYNNLIYSGASTATLSGNLTIRGDVTVSSGTLDLSRTANRESLGGTFTIADGATLFISSSNSQPSNYGAYVFNPASTVNYNSLSNQIVSAQTYGHLVLTNNAIKTLSGATIVRGNLTLNANATLDAANYNLNIGGDWNAGTNSRLIPGTGNVTFDGTVSQNFTPAASSRWSFYDLTINNGNQLIANSGGLIDTVYHALNLTNGSFDLNGPEATDNTWIIQGTVNGAGTIIGSAFSNLEFTGSGKVGTVTFAGGGQQLKNLTMNRSVLNDSLRLGSNLTVSGTLTLTKGKIRINSPNVLTIANTGSISGGNVNSYVDGVLIRNLNVGALTASTGYFPIGAYKKFRPITLSGTVDVGGASVQANMIDARTPNELNKEATLNNILFIHYFGIHQLSGNISNAAVTLSFNTNAPADPTDDDVHVTSPANLRIARSTGAGGGWFWTDAGGTGAFTVAPAGATTSAITTLANPSYFTLASATGDQTLPVELAFFNLMQQENKNRLEWKTESEADNAYWLIQRVVLDEATDDSASIAQAIEAADFTTITTIKGQGSKTSATDYVYDDAGAEPGKIYAYRLADVSYNGVITYHEAKAAAMELPKHFELSQNYPNPFNPTTTIKFQLPVRSKVQIKIYNILGQEVSTLADLEMSAGFHAVQWNGLNHASAKAASGMYIYRLQAVSLEGKERFNKTKKMMLIK
ncbi:T9SS type A sorting domain-containing protein [bacterium]|nr:T9SS type A sorting domain-containing protein [bacterium]